MPSRDNTQAPGAAAPWRLAAWALLVLGLLFASPALAADAHGDEHAAEEAHGDDHGHGPVGYAVRDPESHGFLEDHGHIIVFHSKEEAEAKVKELRLAAVNAGKSADGFEVAALAEDHAAGTLNLFQIHPGTSLWLLITFAILFVVLRKTAWPAIINGLEEREKAIVDAVKSAERTNAEAAALLAEYEGKLASARDEVASIIEEGKRDAAKVKDDIVQKAWAEAEEIKQRNARELEMAQAKMLQDTYDQMSELATSIAGRVLQKEIDASSHSELVSEALTQYQAS